MSKAKRKSKTDKRSARKRGASAVALPSRDALGYMALLGMTLDEIRELGREKFEEMVEQAIEADRKRRHAEIDAKLEAMQRMVEEGRTTQAFSLIRGEMHRMSDEIDRQRSIAKKFARMVYGSRSERLTREELKQLCLAFGVSEQQYNEAVTKGDTLNVPASPAPEETADVAEPAAEPASTEEQKKRSSHRGRRPLALAANVKVFETTLLVPDEERQCAACGTEMEPMRFERHERMEIVPAELQCHVELRQVCSCKACRKDIATAAHEGPLPTSRRVGTSIPADLISEKCSEAQPRHRQHKRYERLGWSVPITTLESAYRWGLELLGPIADVTRGQVLSADYTQADSTTLMVIDPTRDQGRYRGQVWAFRSRFGVAFEFSPSWSADDVAPLFAVNWDAFKQVDDYKGYSSLVTVEGMTRQLVPDHVRLACLMHVRRKYHEALEAKDGRALEPLGLIRRIYEVEAAAKGCTHEERLAMRVERSLPLLGQLKDWVDKRQLIEPPKSLLGIAVRYTHQQWAYIERCFTRGDFEVDNGAIEREIRSIAIGRRNFLFSGSADAASRLCDAYTLVVNAKHCGLDPFVYLRDVLEQLERGFPICRVAELTPSRYAAANKAAK